MSTNTATIKLYRGLLPHERIEPGDEYIAKAGRSGWQPVPTGDACFLVRTGRTIADIRQWSGVDAEVRRPVETPCASVKEFEQLRAELEDLRKRVDALEVPKPYVCPRHASALKDGPGAGYRFLNVGEPVVEGDERWDGGFVPFYLWRPQFDKARKPGWVTAHGWRVGKVAGEGDCVNLTYRRRVAPTGFFSEKHDPATFTLPAGTEVREVAESVANRLRELADQRDVANKALAEAMLAAWRRPYVAPADVGNVKDEPGYEILREGDLIENGDELFVGLAEGWRTVLASVGSTVGDRVLRAFTYRRRTFPKPYWHSPHDAITVKVPDGHRVLGADEKVERGDRVLWKGLTLSRPFNTWQEPYEGGNWKGRTPGQMGDTWLRKI